jgi:hypothetical protein
MGSIQRYGTLRAPTVCRPAQFKRWLLAKRLRCYRLSRHAIMYKEDLRTSSTPGLDRPMSASSRSSSSRSCLLWHRRSHPSVIPASQASGVFQDHRTAGSDDKSRMWVELPQGMFHLRIGVKQRLAAGAHRAVVKGPNNHRIIPALAAPAIQASFNSSSRPAIYQRVWLYARS